MIEDHPDHRIIIGGDLNTELNGSSPFDNMWQDLISKKQFAYCSDRFVGPGYTYRHDALNHTKLNDHFLVQQSILTDKMIDDFKILDEGDNTSDHLPIVMRASVQVQPFHTKTEETKLIETID